MKRFVWRLPLLLLGGGAHADGNVAVDGLIDVAVSAADAGGTAAGVREMTSGVGLGTAEMNRGYMAYNLFRLAAILQGVGRRALDGTATNAGAGDVGSQARAITGLGWIAAERAMAV